ncbi:MAG: 50S ribosomal protein L5 [Patescibacteria group bacterium]|nr:50S ribosomal protein L5 [Patescibacteria group bacterium]
MNRLRKKYQEKFIDQLVKEFKLANKFMAPKIEKVVLNMGVTKPDDVRKRKEVLQEIVEQFGAIIGQKAQITTAKKDIANFGLREGDPIGVMMTLRGEKMWQFLDKLISIALPRVKDFRGVSRTAFDGHGNYSLGLEEQIIFPEIEYDKIDQVRGLQVNIVTNSDNQGHVFKLLELMGLPFAKVEENN